MERKSTHRITLTCLLLMLALATACGHKAEVPDQATAVETQASMFPDYRDIVIPPNIAPLNFQVRDSGATAAVALLQGDNGQEVLAQADRSMTVRIDTSAWRGLLTTCKGKDIRVTVYVQTPAGWVKHRPHTLTVANEDIDPYLSYRLIEPGYELYRQLGIYQRNLTNWDERAVYENNRTYEEEENHCINCHNYRNQSAQDMLFHVRAHHGGTIIVQNGKAHKVQVKDSTILSSAVYPAWHPTQDLVAFSTNKTGQIFHAYHAEKLEVMDEASDMLLYDVSRNEVSHVFRSRDELETFPAWAPSGDRLYYCSAQVGHLIPSETPDSMRGLKLMQCYDSIYYDLKSVPFNPGTRTFGEPRTEVHAAIHRHSITLPRISPDGRYVLYTQGDYGQFHIWHKSSDLWVKNLQTDSCYNLREANSPDTDSFHSWSSNGRWIAFSSRRIDGNYTRVFIAYFDRQGHAHKAFLIPQENPEHNTLLLKSYNVPELTRDAVTISQADLGRCVRGQDGERARYRKHLAPAPAK
ncbi:MAG TPA: hypothetical protein DDW22_07505 [Prevotellaceae bacterium]|nr:hypothetical protein [Prevotellaceae bacterium]